ncbi:MAG: hypothetical protein ACI4J4_04885 [Ruminiclostridium sp.]
MKKKIIPLVVAVLLISGCDSAPSVTEKEESGALTETAAEEVLPEKEEQEENSGEKDEAFSLYRLTAEDLSGFNLKVTAFGSSSYQQSPALSSDTILSDSSIILKTGELSGSRASAGFIAEGDEEDRKRISKAVSTISDGYAADFPKEWGQDIAVLMQNESGEIETADIIRTRQVLISSVFSRGFMRLSPEESGIIEFIPEPAAVRNSEAGVFYTSADQFLFDINGRKIYIDSPVIYLTEEDFRNCGMPDLPEDNSFVYADCSVSGNVIYSEKEGYISYSRFCEITGMSPDNTETYAYMGANSGYVFDCEIITEDTDAVIDKGEEDSGENEYYSALLAGINDIYDETVCNIGFLDMDGDKSHELLVSKLRATNITGDKDFNLLTRQAITTDIYRIESGALKYIDTIYTAGNDIENSALYLGSRFMEEGSSCWFGISDVNLDTGKPDAHGIGYIYRLEGDSLTHEEIFRTRLSSISSEGTSYEYYYMGEKIEVETVAGEKEHNFTDIWKGNRVDYISYDDSQSGEPLQSDGFEVYRYLINGFCGSISEGYKLIDSRFGISEAAIYSNDYKKNTIPLTDRDLKTVLKVKALQTTDSWCGLEEIRFDSFYGAGEGAMKPVIYMYPEEETEVSVKVGFTSGGRFTCTYPEYGEGGEGWTVTAEPEGTLYDSEGSEYYCLYWEGILGKAPETEGGYCVAGKDTADFLREKLLQIGLTPREANEFIIYWLPRMQDNPYNIIKFHTDSYSALAPLTVSPAPDTQIRVFMTYTPAEDPVSLPPQNLPAYTRSGFTLVEWGGGCVEGDY